MTEQERDEKLKLLISALASMPGMREWLAAELVERDLDHILRPAAKGKPN